MARSRARRGAVGSRAVQKRLPGAGACEHCGARPRDRADRVALSTPPPRDGHRCSRASTPGPGAGDVVQHAAGLRSRRLARRSPSKARSHLQREVGLGAGGRARSGERVDAVRADRRSHLLGALDASGASGDARRWRDGARCVVAVRERGAPALQSPLRVRGALLRARGRRHHAPRGFARRVRRGGFARRADLAWRQRGDRTRRKLPRRTVFQRRGADRHRARSRCRRARTDDARRLGTLRAPRCLRAVRRPAPAAARARVSGPWSWRR